jgi:FAD-linked sulfhydryl oxidase
MAENPPKAGSRAELSVWLCEAHNRVNRALGKPVFSCALADLDERWRTGGKHCDETTLAAEREP